MDGLTLLRAATALGLRVHAEEGRLVVRGAKRHASVAKALLAHKEHLLAVLADPVVSRRWPSDAVDVFLQTLGVADELGLDAAPGSPAWETAAREARRVEAGIPHALWTRSPGVIDAALKSFEPIGGLAFNSAEMPEPDPSCNPGGHP